MKEFKDNFEKFFETPDEMLDESQDFKDASEWYKVNNGTISFQLITEDTELPTDIPSEVIMDTVENTQLLMNLNDKIILPVRTCAVPSILRRAGFSCEVAGKLSKQRLSELLTEFMPINGGASIIHKSFHKASFAGAGGSYAPMEPCDLMNILYDEIEKRFKDYDFIRGYISHYETAMKLSLSSMQEEINDAYENIVCKKGGTSRSLIPIVYFSTSELGDSAVHLVGKLYDKTSKAEIGIGSIFEVVHKGSKTMDTFSNNCGKIYSRLLKSTENLARLFDTEIEYSIDCMKRIGKSLGFNKRELDPYFSEAVNAFSYKWAKSSTNAGELYWGFAEMISLMRINGFSESTITATEEKLMTTLSPKFNWKSYDYKIV